MLAKMFQLSQHDEQARTGLWPAALLSGILPKPHLFAGHVVRTFCFTLLTALSDDGKISHP